MTATSIPGAALNGVLPMTWVRNQLAHVLDHCKTNEPSGSKIHRRCRQRFHRSMITRSASCRLSQVSNSRAHRCGNTFKSRGLYTLMQQISRRNGAAMAQKIQTLFIDDLDGSEADGTVRFGLDGTDYEIDLKAAHAQELRDALARYVSAARRGGNGSRRPARSGRRASANGLNTTEVREWAKAQGIDVKDRGRVPAELVVKFQAATGK